MKIGKFVVTVVVFFFMLGASRAQAQWHSWPQWQRYGATVNVALSQNGFDINMDSKKWVKLVIYSASSSAVSLPETKPNKYEWYPHPDVYKFPAPYPPHSWQPGQIVQMKWGHKAHTAIFICRYQDPYQNGMYWVDSDWGHGPTSQNVQYHFVSFSEFAEKVGSNYSVYEIR